MIKTTGKIAHIDFGDSFEAAERREHVPEKVPFRLTRMFVKVRFENSRVKFLKLTSGYGGNGSQWNVQKCVQGLHGYV